MGSSRKRPKGMRIMPFGFAALVLIAIPINAGRQEPGAALAQAGEPRARQALIASPFGTIHAATFSFPRPVGTAIPQPPGVHLASFEVNDPDVTAALGAPATRSRRDPTTLV